MEKSPISSQNSYCRGAEGEGNSRGVLRKVRAEGVQIGRAGRGVKQRAAGTNYEFKRSVFVSRCLFLCFCANRIVSRARQREGGRRREPSRIKPGARALWDLRRLCVVPSHSRLSPSLADPPRFFLFAYVVESRVSSTGRICGPRIGPRERERDLPTICSYSPSINFSRL